jgi:DNA polymerase I-like protein with 3'-5' exonuclease and polymerase domains
MATKTGRAAASSKDNPFMTPRWTRTFMKSPADKVLAYVDYKHQEPCIQAYLSGDRELIEAVKEDVYLHTAKRVGALKGVEPNSDEEAAIRKLYKVGFLAVGYGQSPFSLAASLGMKINEAKEIIHQIKTLYRNYYKWLYGVVDTFKWRGFMSTFYGWTLTCENGLITNQRSLYNWPIQSHGAEMIRWALINLIQEGIEVNATVHDAVLVCLNKQTYEQEIEKVKSIMKRCSEDIVGHVINVDVEKIDGNWIQTKGAKQMFDDVMQELDNE